MTSIVILLCAFFVAVLCEDKPIFSSLFSLAIMSQECKHGAEELNRIITISYVSIQISIALLISVIGAVHVKRCKNEQKRSIQMDETLTLNTGPFSYLCRILHL